MENIKEQIENKLKNIKEMINSERNKEEIELEKRQLDKLLNEYLKKI